jgi:hypothetical protein
MRHENKQFSLTPAVLRLGQSYLHSARLPRIVQPLLYRLAYSLEEAASCGVLDDDQLVCVAAVSAGRLVSTTLQPGTRVPAYCTANGRMLLACLPHAAVERFLERAAPEPITAHTIVNKERLALEIARARERGYALVDQELELGLRTIAGRRGGGHEYQRACGTHDGGTDRRALPAGHDQDPGGAGRPAVTWWPMTFRRDGTLVEKPYILIIST